MNKIVSENSKVGAPQAEWDIIGVDDGSIEGFATEISINLGDTVYFKINTVAIAYRLDIYRMGYYGGNGARKVDTIYPSVSLPQLQPAGLPDPFDPTTGNLDCGNWGVSASWTAPTDVTSGIYFAKLVREDGSTGASHILFIVRDDNSHSDLLFQTSDTTWQAYNNYGDSCLYEFLTASGKRAFKVSYNRPFKTRFAEFGANWVFNAEYPMVRWLEANGYDVSYCSGVDSDRFGDKILQHKILLSVGHDEYWSGQQRANVEAARNAGVHLAFFSGNEVFWKTRWENSIDGTNTPYRTLVCYKETHDNAKIDPTPQWTGTWRDRHLSPPFDGGRPENALTGTIFGAQGFTDNAITVTAEEGKLRFWRNTTLANLVPGQEVSLTPGTLGYEWDQDLDNGFRPAGLIRLSSTVITTNDLLLDNGNNYGPGTATHHLTLYRHQSGALVFGAGTVQWSWGLDDHHDSHGNIVSSPDSRMQQATVNLFADMGVQPGSLQPGLMSASASTDTTPPTTVITTPKAGEIFRLGEPITILGAITGTASDEGGLVAAVEVSVDGGLSWHPAVGQDDWSYSWWEASGNGLVTILSRAIDDSGNIQNPATAVDIIVGEGPGGPVLVIINGSYGNKNPFGNYLGEILRAEGLVAFNKIELTMLMSKSDPLAFLNTFKLVLLAETRFLPNQQQLLRTYVSNGGSLIAMRPDPALADLFGLTFVSERLENPGYPQFFALDTVNGAGIGITSESLQYHGDADNYTLTQATALSYLWDDINTPSSNPAVTLNRYGNGKAAAFTFDLAKSIVLMRQGNPDWRDSEGDGAQGVMPKDVHDGTAQAQYRPMDMFVRHDGRIWFAPERIQIPQADEQQRFLANLILDLIGQPCPRLWYLPVTYKALIINTGDCCSILQEDRSVIEKTLNDVEEHGGTFTVYLMYDQIQDIANNLKMIDANTESHWRLTHGHGVGVHMWGNGLQTYAVLHDKYRDIVTRLQITYGHSALTARSHHIDWVGWVDMAKIEAEFGTRLDLNYYHYYEFSAKYRGSFENVDFSKLNLPVDKAKAHGYFTGSGLPQRFCDENGAILPIYQLLTEWTDEFFADNSFEVLKNSLIPLPPGMTADMGYTVDEVKQVIKTMLIAAEHGYYSAFVANIHPVRYIRYKDPVNKVWDTQGEDPITQTWAHAMWDYAAAQGILMWSAEKYLDFVEARAAARFDNLNWDGTHLMFNFNTPLGGQDLTLMVPDDGLISVDVDGIPIVFKRELVKGRNYALFTIQATSAHVVVNYENI